MLSIIESFKAEVTVSEIWEQIKDKSCAARFEMNPQRFRDFIDENTESWYTWESRWLPSSTDSSTDPWGEMERDIELAGVPLILRRILPDEGSVLGTPA